MSPSKSSQQGDSNRKVLQSAQSEASGQTEHSSPETESEQTATAAFEKFGVKEIERDEKGTLVHLHLSDSQITDAGVAELQKALPACEIIR